MHLPMDRYFHQESNTKHFKKYVNEVDMPFIIFILNVHLMFIVLLFASCFCIHNKQLLDKIFVICSIMSVNVRVTEFFPWYKDYYGLRSQLALSITAFGFDK